MKNYNYVVQCLTILYNTPRKGTYKLNLFFALIISECAEALLKTLSIAITVVAATLMVR